MVYIWPYHNWKTTPLYEKGPYFRDGAPIRTFLIFGHKNKKVVTVAYVFVGDDGGRQQL